MLNLPKPYYERDGVLIYHADCREILAEMAPESVGLIVTSPPYNLGNSTGGQGGGKKASWDAGAVLMKQGYRSYQDNLPMAEYEAWQRECLSAMWAVLATDGGIFYNHKPRQRDKQAWLPTCLIPPKAVLRQVIIWARPGGFNHTISAYTPNHEWILLLAKERFEVQDGAVGDVWFLNPDTETSHPAAFPLELPKRAIATSKTLGLVLDPFMGSGTVLVAAKSLGRPVIGIEIEERYCEIAARRLSQEVMAL